MPRPVFGAVDWWTFAELRDIERFTAKRAGDDGFETTQADAADDLAERNGFACFAGDPEEAWADLEFCVSRGTKTVLMVRRRT